MNLDDQSRARLRALGEAQRVDLDDAARGRIARRVAEEGPRTMRRARRQRSAVMAAGAMAALGVAVWLARDLRAPVAEVPRPSAPAQPVASAPAVAVRACATRATIAPHWSAGAGDAARIDLGALGAVAVQAGTSMWLDAADPCRIALRLEQGRVDVHAVDLAGGELRVQTASGDVLVHGTRFSVQHGANALTVEVDEGRVAVRRREGTLIAMLGPDQRLRAASDAPPVIEGLDANARNAIRAAFEPAAAVAVTAPTAAEPEQAPAAAGARHESSAALALRMVAEADALWRQGERDRARERYRKAGAQSGPTAEAAWLALARRELSAGEPAAASAAIQAYEARFPGGELASEAAGIAYRAALQRGDVPLARQRAELLQRRHPHTPQADAAARWLRTHSAEGSR